MEDRRSSNRKLPLLFVQDSLARRANNSYSLDTTPHILISFSWDAFLAPILCGCVALLQGYDCEGERLLITISQNDLNMT